jgi:hypothetical protein
MSSSFLPGFVLLNFLLGVWLGDMIFFPAFIVALVEVTIIAVYAHWWALPGFQALSVGAYFALSLAAGYGAKAAFLNSGQKRNN